MSGFAATTLAARPSSDVLDGLENIQRYAERIKRRPAWLKAMEIAGPTARRSG
jgi:glutathione S-transferase